MERQGKTTVTANVRPDELIRLGRLGRELRLTDQILSQDLDRVSIVDDGPAPAWTTLDGDHITFALKHMPQPETAVDVAVWLGTNAHELGHVLYSPRSDSTLMRLMINAETTIMPGMAQIHNVVEDQRQERLILARFSTWRGYLVASLGHHLVADAESAWMLMAGRTWLPDAVRAAARARFAAARSEKMAETVAQLVGDYQRLVDPGEADQPEAWRILQALYDLFVGAMPRFPIPCVVIRHGTPSTDADAATGAPRAADEPWDLSGDGDEGDDDSEDEQVHDDATGSGQGASQVTPHSDRPFEEVLRDAMRDAAKAQIHDDEDTAKDLESVLDSLGHGQGGDDEAGEAAGHFTEPTDAARLLHHEVSDALMELKDEGEPGWERRVDNGRLKVRRLLDPNFDPDELFDRYEPGHLDATDLEICLLLDVSASMRSRAQPMAEAAWAIRHAVDDLEGRCTVYVWGTGHRLLADANERPDDRMFVPQTPDGTDPTDALQAAYQLLAGSDARIRLMIVMTDGSWGAATTTSEPYIAAMRASGITTVLAFLPLGRGGDPDGHGCEVAENISEMRGLTRLFQSVAATRIRNQW